MLKEEDLLSTVDSTPVKTPNIPFRTSRRSKPIHISTPPPTQSVIMSPILTFVSIIRLLVGGSSLLSPTFTANIVSYPYHASISSMPYRLFGSRELVLGTCLWLANSSSSELLSPLLLIGAIIDGIDIVSTGVYVLQEGNLSPWAVTISAGGAGLAIALQMWVWSGLRGKGGRKVQ